MKVLVCTPKSLPASKQLIAAKTAIRMNPFNRPRLNQLGTGKMGIRATPQRIAVATAKYWGLQGVHLTVAFLDNAPKDLKKRILLHMNAWGTTANVSFVETSTDPQVRIARVEGEEGGYWSYLGTDILHIKKTEQTMNLEGFTMQTLESEFHRVVRHETGHTLGFPHEHLRKALVAKLDVAKTVAYFKRTQGWSETDVRAQVLTPIEESTLRGTSVDAKSIMCYQLPGSITKDGKALCCVDTAWWPLMKERTTCCWTRSVHQLISRSVAVATVNGLFGSSRLLAELHVLPNQFSLGTGLNNTRSASRALAFTGCGINSTSKRC
jgi:hypothetical protein